MFGCGGHCGQETQCLQVQCQCSKHAAVTVTCDLIGLTVYDVKLAKEEERRLERPGDLSWSNLMAAAE